MTCKHNTAFYKKKLCAWPQLQKYDMLRDSFFVKWVNVQPLNFCIATHFETKRCHVNTNKLPITEIMRNTAKKALYGCQKIERHNEDVLTQGNCHKNVV